MRDMSEDTGYRLRNMKGLCLLAETSGLYPDAEATREVLKVMNTLLKQKINLENLSEATKETGEILKSFGIGSPSLIEKKDRKEDFRWFI